MARGGNGVKIVINMLTQISSVILWDEGIQMSYFMKNSDGKNVVAYGWVCECSDIYIILTPLRLFTWLALTTQLIDHGLRSSREFDLDIYIYIFAIFKAQYLDCVCGQE